jgi:glutamine amidotransferase
MIAIVDYGMGNLRSVVNAFEAIGQPAIVTSRADDVRAADAIVVPGVGAFHDGMRNLERTGLIEVLTEEVRERGKPFLGICLGMQFLAEYGDEGAGGAGLGWIRGTVRRLAPAERRFKVPHIGWNDVQLVREGVLYGGLGEAPVYYFVHGYHLEVAPEAAAAVTATCWHGETVVASVEQSNILGVQFHPEKSQRAGLRLLENFCSMVPASL